jgi:hypothetical protein
VKPALVEASSRERGGGGVKWAMFRLRKQRDVRNLAEPPELQNRIFTAPRVKKVHSH